MKIAQIAPLFESVPPKYYGGTERVVSYLTEELVRQGHDVTLYASGDSITKANLRAPRHISMRLDKNCVDQVAPHVLMMEKIMREADEFDVLHFHIDYLHFPLTRRLKIPSVTTLHGRLDLPELPSLYDEFSDRPVISISNSQRNPLPQAGWVGTVYHGVPKNLYRFQKKSGAYFAFLGRISPEKRVDRAIHIAKKLKTKLKIAAKVDMVDEKYFKEEIEELLDDPYVEYIGEIGEGEKPKFLANAKALLFPIDWPEPFGLVMIEALACGTPVIAHRHGSVPEVIKAGKTGFIVENFEEAVDAAGAAGQIDRRACREEFEKRFTAERMANDYIRIYKSLTGQKEK